MTGLVTVARFGDYMQAELARQLLDNEGITAFVMGQNVASVYGGVPAAVDVELQTPESQADRAREILESAKNQGAKDSEDEESEQDDLEESEDDFEEEDEDDFEEQE
jgi:hypothetical protein